MKNRTALFLTLPFVALTNSGCLLLMAKHRTSHPSTSITVTGPETTVNRTVDRFHAFEIGNAFEIVAAKGPTSVKISAPKDALKQIRSEVDHGTLKIYVDGDLSVNQPLRVSLTSPDLDAATISGASKLKLNDVNSRSFVLFASGASEANVSGSTKDLKINVSGSSKVDWPKLSLETADVTASGGSTVTLSGTAKSMVVNASGASRLTSDALKCGSIKLEGSGASNLVVNAIESLDVNASGATRVEYVGSPHQYSSNATGGASVEKR